MSKIPAFSPGARAGLAFGGVLLALSIPAHADTSLEISGRVSAGLDYVNGIDNTADGGGSSDDKFRGGGNQWGTSLLDIKGSQDLSDLNDALPDDLKAIFLLESGFDAMKGELNGSALFNRRAYAGLSSQRYGTLVFGKNLSLSNNGWYIDPFYQQFMGYETLVRGRDWQGVDNMVQYTTPTYHGWNAEVQIGFGGDTGSFNASRNDAVTLNYVGKIVELRAIYDVRRDDNAQYSDLFLYSREWILGGALHLGTVDLYAGYNGLSAPNGAENADSTGYGYERADHYWAGAHYWVTPRWRLQGALYHINVDNDGGNATLYALGTTYNFADNFFTYASVGTVSNSDAADFAVEATDERPEDGHSQQAVYFGFVYSFKGDFSFPR
ncbi:porin [Solimonas marina]|uniref:Porin n=1 Tax=Solimonas marina TaxID=2714601 RepID=A0A969WD68_9GAMM|nr:porin [Solimonas marina]NKF24049.1 porin [Solimonas marina]